MEGGLVAHKVSNSSYSCPKRSNDFGGAQDSETHAQFLTRLQNWITNTYQNYDDNYCEFRDDPTEDEKYPRIEVFYWKITNAHAARYSVSNQNSIGNKLRLWVNGTEKSGRVDFNLKAGENKTIELALATGNSRANYQPGANEPLAAISYGRAATGSLGSDWTICDVTIIDDDNSAYIGGLTKHPYDGRWMTNKPCYERGCARDDSNF